MTENLNETNFEKFAKGVIEQYDKNGQILDVMLWGRVIGYFKRYKLFYDHIQSHLKKDQKVICKICGKTMEEVVKNA